MGTNLRIIPEGNCAGSYRLWYEEGPTLLAIGADTLDSRVEMWEEYIVLDGAIKLGGKSEEDVSVWMAEKQAMTQRIVAMAASRDDGAPDRVTDVYDCWTYED